MDIVYSQLWIQYFHLKSYARVVITIETKVYETPAALAMSCIRLFDRILLASTGRV